jgi:hypothetical protein
VTNNPNPGFGWNANAGRYVDMATGRFMPREAVFDIVDQSIETLKLETKNFIAGVIDRQVPIEVLHRAAIQEIKLAHLESYAAGRGGWAQMTQADYGRIGQMLRQEYGYLRGFMQDVADGKLSEAQIKARFDKYMNKSMTSFHLGARSAGREAGHTKRIRLLGPTDNHCPQCPGYANKEVDIDAALPPPPGQACDCGGSCLCNEITY